MVKVRGQRIIIYDMTGDVPIICTLRHNNWETITLLITMYGGVVTIICTLRHNSGENNYPVDDDVLWREGKAACTSETTSSYRN